jgi:23S rRNA (adenine2503-C2)-methyltransferase
MALSLPVPSPLPIHGLTRAELLAEARARLHRGAGSAARLYRDVVGHGVFDPAARGLGPEATAAWCAAFSFDVPRVAHTTEEPTPTGITGKAVLTLSDGLEVEVVRIPMGRGKHTLCISSQVGCKMGCAFCETGRMGLLRHLSVAEITGQVLTARHVLGWSFGNIVFMGMGEPLDNLDAVVGALRIFTDSAGLAIGHERITICTVGRAEGIRRIAALGLKRLNLSVSLNAAFDELRSKLMPVNRTTPLAELQSALAEYRPRRNFCLAVNYCLMPDINDSRADASAIAAFCSPLGRVMVNVIPYNPGSAPITRAPTEDEIVAFIDWLRDEGLPVRRRITKGRELMAACGQLGNVELRRGRRALVVRTGSL